MLLVVISLGIVSLCFARCEPDKRLANIFSVLVFIAAIILILLCVLDLIRYH